MALIVAGFCECGCGEPAPISKATNRKRGYIAGQPRRFIRGHQARVLVGRDHPRWKGGRRKAGSGYIYIYAPDSPRGFVAEHLVVAEKALGHPLPARAAVHHVNGDKADNRPENLVICQDHAYHMLLHQRQRALDACGEPNARLCTYCKTYDKPENLYIPLKTGNAAYHRVCYAERCRALRAQRKRQLVSTALIPAMC